jgi:murein DD-endopeptidase MepM/ murein hydrolase activator NlpD
MPDNQYTIFISPPRAGKSRYFSLHLGTFYSIVFFVLIFIIGDCIAILKYLENHRLIKENSKLKNENEKLEKIATIVEKIEKNEAFIEDFLGMGKAGSTAGMMGQGGGSSADFTDETLTYDNGTEKAMPALPQTAGIIQSPVERAINLNNNLEGIIDVLVDRKSQWDTKPSILPVEADRFFVTSAFGWRVSPFTGRRQFHRGMDISSRRGAPVIAPADGTVSEVGRDRFIGRFIRIAHNRTFSTLYGHLLEIKVTKGQKVKRGKLIGRIGNSGMSTGHHLHYEVYQDGKNVNPVYFILNSHAPQMAMAKQ